MAVTYEYDEWGNVTSITGNQALADANPYRYVGKDGVLYDKDINLYLMGWRDYDPSTGRFIVPDEYEGEEDEPTSLNRYLYADADPVNNIDPDGHAPKWLQKGWKSTKKIAKKGLKFGVLDDINTLRSPNSKWYHKAGAAASLASNFVPGAGVAKFGVKLGAKAISKGAKGLKAKKFVATTVKQNRTVKAKKQAVMAKAKPKPVQSVNKGNTRKSNKDTGKYQVGAYKDIKGVKGLDAHHVGQKAAMKKLVKNYDLNTAPAINVPKVGHTIKGPNGIVSRSAKGIDNPRQLLARDIRELRRVYDDIPNSALKKLIKLNKKMYPEMRK
ncbi:RHS repeat-associated core domain-containing protein [Sutcliffiella horikoshii]|uniref:RHS repeat-associated core domain-containing protein n=1 Tax=Sutcliffiella horikoshii TaxID=79883 RepID=UPI002F26301B